MGGAGGPAAAGGGGGGLPPDLGTQGPLPWDLTVLRAGGLQPASTGNPSSRILVSDGAPSPGVNP